ncbi:MAG: hypothetical protein AAB373_04045 [Patescibacteria group bacterium]
MTTKIIGIKKFRENITSLWKEAKKEKIKYIIMHHSEPIFEVTPIVEEELILEKYAKDIAEARQEAKRGEVHTQEEIMKEFGLL